MKIKRQLILSNLLITFLYLFSGHMVSAQNASLDKTVESLNRMYAGNCSFLVKNTQMQVKYFENGLLIREDHVYLEQLDENSVEYLPDEGALVIKCLEGQEECIVREIFKLKLTRKYNRILFLVDAQDEQTIAATKQALVHLIRLVQEIDYK